ncbi:hypothetical protein LJR219_003654 [Phenylobacterium sp. LjRoot219]|uniref:DUF3558 family protein n=1 Tax=Phenylobacterium sp. LjRoot219 TaxID=3342283 RepID=UPI003ECE0996
MFGSTAKIRALAGVLAALAVAGGADAGQRTEAPAPATGLDLCARLSRAQVAEILRTPVALAEPDTDVGSRSCVYSLTRDGPSIVVSHLAGDWEAIRAEFRTSQPEPVAGVGRQALWYPADHALQVEADDGTVLRVGFNPANPQLRGQHKTMAIDLARAALIALR